MTIHYLSGKGLDSNIFMVDGRRPFLVDAGTGQNTDSILHSLGEVMDMDSLDRIILTHRHYDHVGGAAELRRRLGAMVYIHELDAQPVRMGDDWGTQSKMFGFAMEPVEVETLQEGAIVSTGDRDFEVLHTPGHSAGSIALFCERDGSLIAGDTVFVGGVGRWDLPSGDYPQLVNSLRRLAGLKAVDLYPGHGPCGLNDAQRHIRDALRCLGES
jgi:hydroxyacylglutathione hydrolase